jgi:hypothetical protein
MMNEDFGWYGSTALSEVSQFPLTWIISSGGDHASMLSHLEVALTAEAADINLSSLQTPSPQHNHLSVKRHHYYSTIT